MALAVCPPHRLLRASFLQESWVRLGGGSSGEWRLGAPAMRSGCHSHFGSLRSSVTGTLGVPSVCHAGLFVVQCRSLMETRHIIVDECSCSDSVELIGGDVVRASRTHRTSWNSLGVRDNNLRPFLLRLMANLGLLGILTALALGVSVKAATASGSGPRHGVEWKISSRSSERRLVESHCLDDVEEIGEDVVWSGAGENAAGTPANGSLERGLAMAAEDEFDDEEDRREYEELRSKPYAITVPLRIVGLRGSVPPVWLKDFMISQGKRVKLMAEFKGSLGHICSDLTSALGGKKLTPRSAMAADLVTIGDSWLAKAVSGGLISPIENAEQFEWYQRIGTKWQTFLRRNEHGLIDPNGEVWGVPYRWGSLVIAYNSKKLQKNGIAEIKDWADLWKPELAGKIAMVASTRDVVGAVLKALGASYNVEDFDTDVPGGKQAVKEKFCAFQKQVLLFDDVQYLKTLGAGEVWVAVGWSGDVIPFARRTSNIVVIAPQSGTSLWADLWAIPATKTIRSTKVGGRIRGPSPLVLQWFDFCLQPARANSFQHVSVGSSPLVLSGEAHHSVREVGLQDNSGNTASDSNNDRSFESNMVGGMLPPDIAAKSEFLEPLGRHAVHDFEWLLSKTSKVQRFPTGTLDSIKHAFQRFVRTVQ